MFVLDARLPVDPPLLVHMLEFSCLQAQEHLPPPVGVVLGSVD